MKKIIKINEDSFNRLFNNSINEITLGAIDDAEIRSYDLFGGLDGKIDSVIYSVRDALENYDEFYNSLSDRLKNGVRPSDGIGYSQQNPYLSKIEMLADQLKDTLESAENIAGEIESIINKKTAQRRNFSNEIGNIDYDKYYRDTNNPDELNYIEDNEMDFLRKNYPKV